MELRQEYEDAVDHLRAKLDEALREANHWKFSYNELFRDFTSVCDKLADAEARVDELEFYIERDKDGDGFISKDAMDLLFPDTVEGEAQ